MKLHKKSNRMTAYRVAKKAIGLHLTEHRTLLAIADTCSMSESLCRKSLRTIRAEHAIPARTFRYGVYGRKRDDGSEYFPGLIARGIITIMGGGTPKDGVPTSYKINLDVLQTFTKEGGTSAQTSAQNTENLCTNDPKPLHNESQTSAQWQTSSKSSSKESSKERAEAPSLLESKAKSGGQEKESTSSLADYVLEAVYRETDGRGKVGLKHLPFIQEAIQAQQPSRELIDRVISKETANMDDFLLRHLGDTLATNLGPALKAQAKEDELRRKSNEAAQEAIAAAQKKNAAEREAQWVRMRAEDELAERLKDNPFGDSAVAS